MQAVEEAKQLQLPLVVDGSALNILALHPSVLRGSHNALLTPNLAEMGRNAAGLRVDSGRPIRQPCHMKVGGSWPTSPIYIAECRIA